jgi:phosphoribosyl 1,2-cyclic phosphodiesterase
MLRRGSYPPELKRRIAGSGGHLSNEDAADLVWWCRPDRMKWLVAAHISEENNLPELAIAAHCGRLGTMFPVIVAPRHTAGPMLSV